MEIHDSLKKYGLAGFSVKVDARKGDELCPVCGAETDGYSDLEFQNGNGGCCIRVEKGCCECGSSWALFYPLDFAYIRYDGMAAKEES